MAFNFESTLSDNFNVSLPDNVGIDLPELPDPGGPLPGAEQILNDLSRNLSVGSIENLINRLPPEQRGPDDTGSVLTGASDIGRAEAKIAASLAAAPRIALAFQEAGVTMIAVGNDLFTVQRLYEDVETGLTGLHLRAVNGGQDIFAFDGLEVGSRADALAAIDLGRPQVASPIFAEMVADARDAALAEGRSLLFTGPSLGGALAQAAAYETAEALLVSGAPVAPGTVKLVTVDPLGGREATESLNGGVLDPAVLAQINALNMRTEGDLISRIGSHVGETVSFQPVNSAGQPVSITAEQAHVNVESLLATLSSDALFAAGRRGAPEEISGFAALSNTAADAVVEQARQQGFADDPNREVPLQIPGTASFSPSGLLWGLNADDSGPYDLVVAFATPTFEQPPTSLPSGSDLILG